MVQSRIIMGMPITIKIEDPTASNIHFEKIFTYFNYVDQKFSTYKDTSEISQINSGKLKKDQYSPDMKSILKMCEQAKWETHGFFDINHNGKLDPSGLVKGWSIHNAGKLISKLGFKNYFVDAGGDIQIAGKVWKIGIRNPFKTSEIVKVLNIQNLGVATSGVYERGRHLYNPKGELVTDILSLTVIGPDILQADKFATAAFAMGRQGINFIEELMGFEGYMIDEQGIATYTTGFQKYAAN